jgi:hypothetical protein
MELYDFKFLIAKYVHEFSKKSAKNPEQFAHYTAGKVYYYMNKKPKIRIYYHPYFINPEREVYIDVSYISIDHNGQALYGYNNEYGHNVYMTCDEDFYKRISRITERTTN